MYNRHAYMDTILHMDITDAINIPVYMEAKVKRASGGWVMRLTPYGCFGSVKM